jgi:hypothetical protein
MSLGPRVLLQCIAVTDRFCNHHIFKKCIGRELLQVADTYRIGQTLCSVHTSGRLVRHKTLHSESSILYPLLHEDYCRTLTLHRAPQVQANITQRRIWRLRKTQYPVYFAVTKKRYVNRAWTFRNNYCCL